jgi:hypothetical protein
MRPVVICALLTALLALLVVGCGAPEPELTLPETSVLLDQSSVALVIEPYLRLHDRPATSAGVIGHARRGDVLAVIGVTGNRHWVELEGPARHGWARAEQITLYASRERAYSARRALDD